VDGEGPANPFRTAGAGDLEPDIVKSRLAA